MKTMVEQFCTSIRLKQRPASLQFTGFSKDLIAGTYQLDSSGTSTTSADGGEFEGTSREGGLYVVGADNNELQIKQETIFPGGVFRFELNEKEERLVAALSNGHLALLRQKERSNLLCLQSDFPVCDAGMLLNCSAQKNQVLCTNNLGQFFITNIDRGETEVIVDAHSSRYGLPECEVWSCAWHGTEVHKPKIRIKHESPYWMQTLITGAEDANLKIWDLRSSNSTPQNVDGKSHSAGIISIVKCRRRGAECFLTGSYDDHLRLFDLRLFGRPVSELKLNGGPWDAKPIGEECFVVSCMYGGWSIVRQTPNSTLALVHCHPKNGSNLLYGADAERIIGTDGEHSQIYRVASCTFNDSKVHMERISFGDEINLL